MVLIALAVEVVLQIVWISVARCGAVASSERVAKTDNDRQIVIRTLCLCRAVAMERSGKTKRK